MLCFLPEDAMRLAFIDHDRIEHSLKLNCVFYIMHSIDLIREESGECDYEFKDVGVFC